MKSLPILAVLFAAGTIVVWTGGHTELLAVLAADDEASQATENKPLVEEDTSREPPVSEEALQLMQEARQRLFERMSVQANIRETINIGSRKFRGEGTYVAGRFPKLRLTLNVGVGDTKGEVLEVCDGFILWTVQQITGGDSQQPEIQVSRTVINEVREALDRTLDVPEALLIGGIGVGGLPSLLAALERSMTFEALRELEEDGHKYNVIQGRWSDEFLSRITGGDPNAELPGYMPDHVRIYFDAETKFPTRILYMRWADPAIRSSFVALLSLDFTDIILDAPVDDELFQYTPPQSVQVRDRTVEYLKMIEEAAEKGREPAVRGDGSVPVGDE